MTFTRIEYLTSEMMGPPEALLIHRDGLAQYEAHSNVADAGLSDIGTYETTLSPKTISALTTAFAYPPFRDLADHWGRILAGDRTKRVVFVTETERLEKMVGTDEPVPPRLQALIDILDQIAREVRLHPRQVLTLSVGEFGLSTTGMLTATITFANKGHDSLTCTNPSFLNEIPGGRLCICGRPDTPASEISLGDMFDVDVLSVSLQSEEQKASPHPWVDIPPGGAMTFRISAPLPISIAEPYVLQVLYRNTATEREGHEVLIGELYSVPLRLEP